MRTIISDIKTFLVAIVGLIGGIAWGYSSNWEIKPIILTIVSSIEIICFLILKFAINQPSNKENSYQQNINNNYKVEKQVNIQNNEGNIEM